MKTDSWKVKAAWVVLGVAGVFCAALVVLMLATAVQMRQAPPLDAPEFQALRELIREKPDNVALRDQVHALDLLVRRAHFVSMKALRVGGGLLVAGVAVLLIAAHVVRDSRVGVRPPGKIAGEETPVVTLASRRAVLVALGVLVLMGFLIPVLRRGPIRLRKATPRQAGERALPDGRVSHVPGRARSPSGPEAAKSVTCPWPSFRGPNGLGVAENVDPPLTWDGAAGSNVLWKSVVPRAGFSSPIVCGNRVFLSGGDASLREVYCYNANSGALEWRHPATGIAGSSGALPEVTDDTGYAASTMAGADGRVFAIFATGDVVALDYDGRRLWARHLGLPDNPYGHASSLLVHKDLLYVQLDDNKQGQLLALNVADGSVAWSVKRDVELPCWSSPVIMQTSRGPELILNGNPLVIGYDPRSGAERWREDCMEGEVAVSVAAADGVAFVANEYARLVALRLDDKPARLWETEDDLPDVSSPVAGPDYLVVPTAFGLVTCRDTATGETLWTHEFDDGFYASPVIAAGRVYLMDLSGVMRVFTAGRTFDLLASNPLGERATSTAAFAGGRVYVRGVTHLFCLEAAGE